MASIALCRRLLITSCNWSLCRVRTQLGRELKLHGNPALAELRLEDAKRLQSQIVHIDLRKSRLLAKYGADALQHPLMRFVSITMSFRVERALWMSGISFSI